MSRRPRCPTVARWRTAGSRDGTCQRSSAATNQSRLGDPSHGSIAPHGVTSARHDPPATPVVVIARSSRAPTTPTDRGFRTVTRDGTRGADPGQGVPLGQGQTLADRHRGRPGDARALDGGARHRGRAAAADVRRVRRRRGRGVGGVARRDGAVGAGPRSQRCRRRGGRDDLGEGLRRRDHQSRRPSDPTVAAHARPPWRRRHRSRPPSRRHQRARPPVRDRTPRFLRPRLVPPAISNAAHRERAPGDGAPRHRAVARSRHGRRPDPPVDPPPRHPAALA